MRLERTAGGPRIHAAALVRAIRSQPARISALAIATIAALAGCAAVSAPRAKAAFAFAVLGDAPYGAAAEGRFAATLAEINDDSSVRFVLHAGDLKGGGEPCTDDLLRRRIAQLQTVRSALVYTPGDNDWTDCHRGAAGRHPPLERLAALRRLAFPTPTLSLGQQALQLQSQAGSGPYGQFVENALFTHGGVLFVTLHVVGSNNDLEPWHGIDPSDRTDNPRRDRISAFRQRQAANLAWLEAAFARAEGSNAVAAVVLMHANPRFELRPGHAERAGFEDVLAALRRLTLRFGRPVLLVHGDRHLFIVDRPLAGASPPAPNLLRVQTFGEPLAGWVRVDVDPARPTVFRVELGRRPTSTH